MDIFINKINHIFESNGDKLFVTCSITQRSYLYSEILVLSQKCATLFHALGVRKGDKIAVLLSNCVEYIVIYFACMHVGCVIVPINQRLHKEEIKYILQETNPSVFLFEQSQEKQFSDLRVFVKQFVQIVTLTNTLNDNGGNSFFDTLNVYESRISYIKQVQDDDLFAIMYTSGTTSRPKGVTIVYKNIISNGLIFVDAMDLSSDLVFYALLDLAYLGGLYNLLLIPFLAQARIVLAKTFDPKMALNFWQETQKYEINALWLVPSIVSMILLIDRSDGNKDYACRNVKKVLIGTAPLPALLKKRFEEKYGVILYENYGLSETFFVSTNSPKQPYSKGVGKVIPGCSVIIKDSENCICKKNQIGEVFVKKEYGINRYCSGGELVDDEYFATGDIGYFDEDDYLIIMDRKKDVIIRGGINISPREIEDIIRQHPAVKDVSVIGLMNEYQGEEVVAVVKRQHNIDEQALKMHCGNFLAAFKIPSKIIFDLDFPYSVTGKIQKNQIKKLIIERMLRGS